MEICEAKFQGRQIVGGPGDIRETYPKEKNQRHSDIQRGWIRLEELVNTNSRSMVRKMWENRICEGKNQTKFKGI